jgi:hypothetical protein
VQYIADLLPTLKLLLLVQVSFYTLMTFVCTAHGTATGAGHQVGFSRSFSFSSWFLHSFMERCRTLSTVLPGTCGSAQLRSYFGEWFCDGFVIGSVICVPQKQALLPSPPGSKSQSLSIVHVAFALLWSVVVNLSFFLSIFGLLYATLFPWSLRPVFLLTWLREPNPASYHALILSLQESPSASLS